MAAAGLGDKLDEACITLAAPGDASGFIAACAPLRHWQRELKVDLDADPS
jgi:catalase